MSPEGSNGPGRLQIDAAYDTIRSAILRCELAPSAIVTELQLSTRFGFGRAAVRSALTRLTHEQLVKVEPRRGYSIAPVTFKHVQDLYGVRLSVEPAAAALAAENASERLLDELETWNRACIVHIGQANLVAPREANKRFHVAVAAGSGNERMESLTATLMDELDRVLYLPQLAPLWDRLEATYDDHERIIAAIRQRDPAAARQTAHDHVVSNRRSAIEALIADPGLGAINLLTL
jgi:DNA-binding GntR family transcriptional regulator